MYSVLIICSHACWNPCDKHNINKTALYYKSVTTSTVVYYFQLLYKPNGRSLHLNYLCERECQKNILHSWSNEMLSKMQRLALKCMEKSVDDLT